MFNYSSMSLALLYELLKDAVGILEQILRSVEFGDRTTLHHYESTRGISHINKEERDERAAFCHSVFSLLFLLFSLILCSLLFSLFLSLLSLILFSLFT